MMKGPKLIVAAAALALLQIGILGSMVMSRAAVLRSGQEVLLRVQPVDPRDLLRGEYVVLGYEISTLRFDQLEEAPAPGTSLDRDIHVRLRESGEGHWTAVSARMGEAPEEDARDGDVVIRGQAGASVMPERGALTVRYGIERFYVPEGQGRAIEEDMREGGFSVTVAVSQSGSGQIKSLYHDGSLVYREPIY